jgi:thioredoxin 1
MLRTNLNHLETEEAAREVIKITKGRDLLRQNGTDVYPGIRYFGPTQAQYPDVCFYDMEFDIPAARFIKKPSVMRCIYGLPFTVYFKNGKVATATTSIQKQGTNNNNTGSGIYRVKTGLTSSKPDIYKI